MLTVPVIAAWCRRGTQSAQQNAAAIQAQIDAVRDHE
jgi:hypothetical protein